MLGTMIMKFRVLIFERASYTNFFLHSFYFLGHRVLISVPICPVKFILPRTTMSAFCHYSARPPCGIWN